MIQGPGDGPPPELPSPAQMPGWEVAAVTGDGDRFVVRIGALTPEAAIRLVRRMFGNWTTVKAVTAVEPFDVGDVFG